MYPKNLISKIQHITDIFLSGLDGNVQPRRQRTTNPHTARQNSWYVLI